MITSNNKASVTAKLALQDIYFNNRMKTYDWPNYFTCDAVPNMEAYTSAFPFKSVFPE
jgi:hypothetical protein